LVPRGSGQDIVAAQTCIGKGPAYVRFGSLADICSAQGNVRFTPRKRTFRHSAVRAREELLELCHRHHGCNRVGNETILVGGMVHFIEFFRTGFSVAAPCNLWA